jgi:hypothetical protein
MLWRKIKASHGAKTMKLRFLCANHREWLCNEPQQAVHRCANSFETGWHLSQLEQWSEAMPHMGCAFETAEILLSTRAMAPARAIDWFLHSLAGLTQTLEKLGRMGTCMEVHQAAIDRLRKEAAQQIAPELEADIYHHITRLNRDRRQLSTDGGRLSDKLQALSSGVAYNEPRRTKVVQH